MTSGPVRVLLICHGALGAGLLNGLLQTPDCVVVGVFPWSRRHKSRGDVDMHEYALRHAIHAHGLTALGGGGVNTYAFTEILARLQPECLLIGSWGEILKPHLLERPGLTVVNCHPSLLPGHRGPNPYATAIRAGETRAGITFHRVDAGIDTGPVLLQYPVPIFPVDTGGDLRDRCAQQARERVGELIALIRAGRHAPERLAGTPQDKLDNGVAPSQFGLLTQDDAQLDWRLPPEALVNQSRAFLPWMACFGYLRDRRGRRVVTRFTKVSEMPVANRVDAPPGALLAVTSRELRVASCDPGVVATLEGVDFYRAGVFWPLAWRGLLANGAFCVGARFETPA